MGTPGPAFSLRERCIYPTTDLPQAWGVAKGISAPPQGLRGLMAGPDLAMDSPCGFMGGQNYLWRGVQLVMLLWWNDHNAAFHCWG